MGIELGDAVTMADNKGSKCMQAHASTVDDVLMKARDIWRRVPTGDRSLLTVEREI